MSETIKVLDDASFDAFVKEEGIRLVDFSADWCAPCKSLAKLLEKIAPAYEGILQMGGVNADDYPGTASKYGIMSLPTVLIFKNGILKEKLSGMISESLLRTKLDGLS